jgi:hypothetical protein
MCEGKNFYDRRCYHCSEIFVGVNSILAIRFFPVVNQANKKSLHIVVCNSLPLFYTHDFFSSTDDLLPVSASSKVIGESSICIKNSTTV